MRLNRRVARSLVAEGDGHLAPDLLEPPGPARHGEDGVLSQKAPDSSCLDLRLPVRRADREGEEALLAVLAGLPHRRARHDAVTIEAPGSRTASLAEIATEDDLLPTR